MMRLMFNNGLVNKEVTTNKDVKKGLSLDKKKLFTICVFIFTMQSLTSCSFNESVDEDKKVNYSEISKDSGNLEFFGFALVNTYVDDNQDKETKMDYTDEVKEFTNIVDTLVVEPNQDISPILSYNKQEELLTLVHCFELFYYQEDGGRFVLRKDFEERYDEFYSLNELSNNPLIMYIGEEPIGNGLSNDDVRAVSDYIKSVDANIITMVIEAAPWVKKMEMIETVDYVGFDLYFHMDPSQNEDFMEYLEYFEDNILDHQKIVLIMDTHFIKKYHKNHGKVSLEQMGQVAINYYDLARSRENVVGLLGYFWPSGFDDKTAVGARNMPDYVKEVYKEIGSVIKSK